MLIVGRGSRLDSEGYTYDREMTVTYNVNGPPTESGSGSGGSWSETDSQHSAQSDSISGYWIGNGTGNSWHDVENHSTESWNGGSTMDQSWSQTYGDGSAPVQSSSSANFGSGNKTTNGSFTFGGSSSATQTITFPESIQPVGYYPGRGGPGSTNTPTGDVAPSAPSVYGGGQQQSASGQQQSGTGQQQSSAQQQSSSSAQQQSSSSGQQQSASGVPWYQGVVDLLRSANDASTGILDSLSFGLTKKITAWDANRQSVAHSVGEVGTDLYGGRGLLKTGSKHLASLAKNGADAVASRVAAATAARGVAKEAMHQHHLLPTQFEKIFQKAGLEIKEFKIPLEASRHNRRPNGIHTGTFEESWNGVWEEYLKVQRSPQEILDQLAKMRRDFGI